MSSGNDVSKSAQTDAQADAQREYIRQMVKITARYSVLADKVEKDPNRYLFIGRNAGEFSGNVKYLYLHFLRKVPQATCHFLTLRRDMAVMLSDAGMPVLHYPSDTVDELVRAGTVVVDSISYRRQLYWPLIRHARHVQLWHGIGNKKIGFQLEGAACLQGRDQTLVEDHEGYDVLVSTSEFYTEEVFKKSIGAKEFVNLGYPRTDVFTTPLSKDLLVGCDVEAYGRVVKARKTRPVVLFAPTFRDTGVHPLTQGVMSLEELIAGVNALGAHLLIKTHNRTPIVVDNVPENVTICHSRSDIYPFLPLVDAMITDYSSIYTEYLLLDRPVIFFWADFESYMTRDRGFQFPFEEMCPGTKCRSSRELFAAVNDALRGRDDWAPARRSMRERAFAHPAGGACERIAEYLLAHGGEAHVQDV
ncbi:MAG: CDP-glycerol glycerophosphotransferase family protein [Desulfovibrionaceae bacterium]